ncbi:MAG: type II toxin-antitoxin system RelE/ParE family toxin [Candidatus Caenarcaniphilales bacterium]|nr:type II toxin-antitoxin system RelE/ParE family toxin [Candidatus Caenarcaniphilales bacterium]
MNILSPKEIEWFPSAKSNLDEFPEEVKDHIGYALWVAQIGGKHEDVKPLVGFHGAGVLEVVSDFSGDTFRAVYTVKFKDVLYVLHAFQKKSKKGIETPKADIDLIKSRLKDAEAHYKQKYGGK